MQKSAVAFGLAGLAAAGTGFLSLGSSAAAPLDAEILAAPCSSGNRAGIADLKSSYLKVDGVPVEEHAEIHAGDMVQTDPYGAGTFCLRMASLNCEIAQGTTVRVLPPKKPKVLLRLVRSEGGVFCTAKSDRQWDLETGRRERILIGEATQQRQAARRLAPEHAREDAAAARSVNVLSLVVTKNRTLVKVRRGVTIVASEKSTRRAVVLGRQQQVVVPAGRDPRQPTKITLKPSEKRTFKELEKSLPAVTDKTPPAVMIQGPRDPSSVRSATFSLRANEGGATFSCALDGSNFRLCTSPHRIEGLKPGRHTFAVRSTDTTGNTRTNSFSWTIDSSRIAFVSDRDGNLEIYAMEPDGTSQVVRLTTNSAANDAPEWSPDRRRIAFHSERDGNAEIYVMNADGSGQTRLTINAATDRNPSWAPDGTRLAFESFRDGNREIYVMNVDGSNVRRLTTNRALDFDPAWSPDGGRIAFASNRDNDNYEIYVMNADGTAQTRLTNDPVVEFNPAWSPDGKRIAFHSFRGPPAQYQNLYTMNPDGSGVVRITQTQRNDWNPAWAPDGGHLVFQSDRDTGAELHLYIVDVDSKEQTKLTTGSSKNLVPDW